VAVCFVISRCIVLPKRPTLLLATRSLALGPLTQGLPQSPRNYVTSPGTRLLLVVPGWSSDFFHSTGHKKCTACFGSIRSTPRTVYPRMIISPGVMMSNPEINLKSGNDTWASMEVCAVSVQCTVQAMPSMHRSMDSGVPPPRHY